MESSNWRSAQGEPSSMEAPSADWRSQLQPDARQRIVNKIMDTLKRHLPVVGPEGIGELKKIALRFEEKIYSAAVNQSDYLRRISMKMLSMETKTQQNTSMSSQPGINQNSTDAAGLLGGPLQVNNQGQPLSQIPMVSQPTGRQQLLAQNMQNNAPSSMQGSSSLSATSSITGFSQSTLTNYGHTSNLQNMPGMSHSSVNNSLAQGTTTDIYGNAQRQMQNRQQQSILSQQQQQSQNPLLYQNQLQPQLLQQKMHNNAHLQSIQQQQQQQSLFQVNQLQSSQQSAMQMPSGQSSIQQSQATTIQSAPQPSLQQNQLNSIQQSVTSLLPNTCNQFLGNHSSHFLQFTSKIRSSSSLLLIINNQTCKPNNSNNNNNSSNNINNNNNCWDNKQTCRTFNKINCSVNKITS
ncbi:Mediator of RNA polymerase II transcription subunit 15a [Platanthera guangdongensis]|uniref:Mediator of RNA polymerase II transcription subunit 15a n=1 Tax=Platanthera guangdongensis TaxID=2320717 RepID=A0ABR2MT48_9ASPA